MSEYTHKKITADAAIHGGLIKRWQLYNAETIEMVDYETWKASPLPDTTERDFFGGVIYE